MTSRSLLRALAALPFVRLLVPSSAPAITHNPAAVSTLESATVYVNHEGGWRDMPLYPADTDDVGTEWLITIQ